MEKIEQGQYYHIYNRGINSDIIFKTEGNMHYFFKLIDKHLKNKVAILAYSLMNNHFHLLVKIEETSTITSQAFSNLFNAYSKAYNKQQQRTGTLFERPFKRIKIQDEKYLKNLILYIHKNPEHHNIVKNFINYEFTSFDAYLTINNSTKDILQEKQYILSLFGGIENFKDTHRQDLSGFQNLTGLSWNI